MKLYKTEHQKRIDLDEGWCATLHYITIPQKRIDLDEGWCANSSLRFLNLWLEIALEWLHECCMGFVLGRKPEHETLYFSV